MISWCDARPGNRGTYECQTHCRSDRTCPLHLQVFGVTRDPFIIYTSNIFAILSLRALYGFVATVMSELRFLDKSVALVLGFIGASAAFRNLGLGGLWSRFEVG